MAARRSPETDEESVRLGLFAVAKKTRSAKEQCLLNEVGGPQNLHPKPL
jgi:hypothetical protein